jgi:RNA polymerase sigma-70 factor (ECF subfamily)
MDPSDDEFVERYRRGEVLALEELAAKYRAQLFGFILGLTQSRTEADDVFQEVWLRAIRKLSHYKRGNFFGWLLRIARNIAIDRARKRKPEVSLDQPAADGEAGSWDLPSRDRGPARHLADRDTGRRIMAAVAALPLEQREVFLMRVQLDLQFKEIAKAQRVSINTSLARMQYALGKLRQLLAKDYAEIRSQR